VHHTDPELPCPPPGASQNFDHRYTAFFSAFNEQRFFEAHEILEALWLPIRRQPEGDFYKGLIQLAGAFVHFQKDRLGPAVALLRLARKHLSAYPCHHEGLTLEVVLRSINEWEHRTARAAPGINPYRVHPPPRLDPPELRVTAG